VVLRQQRDGIVNGHGGSDDRRLSLHDTCRDERAAVKPAPFDQTDDLLGIREDDRRATVTKKNIVVEEQDFGVGAAFVEGSEAVFEELACGAIFDEGIKGVGIFEARRTQRINEDGAVLLRPFGGQAQEIYAVSAGKRIRRGSQNGDVMVLIDVDHSGFHQPGRSHGQLQKNIGLRIAKLAQDVSRGKEIAVFVDEESVAIKDVVVATIGRRLIDGVNDGANGGR
jgi:hypothetical protein